MLDVRRLTVLREVARQGSLSAAARALDYTQPAVGHHVQRLEAEVGQPLIVRVGRGVRLTDAGERLVAHAEDVLRRLDVAEEDMAEFAGLRSGRVRLASFPSAVATLAAGAIAQLRALHPGVEVSLAELEPPEALGRLRAGEADVAIAFSYPEEVPREAGVERVHLLSDELLAVLPDGHRLAGAHELGLEALAGETWIGGCERCRSHLLHECAAAGFAPEIAFATDDALAVQALVVAGVGVALVPALALSIARHPGVAAVRLCGHPTREVYAAGLATWHRPPRIVAMLDCLRAAGASQDLALS